MKRAFLWVALLMLPVSAPWADPPSWAQKAAAAKAAGDYSRLISVYQRALLDDPSNARIRLDLARSYEAQGRVQEALTTAEGLRDSGSSSADVQLLIGRLQARQQEWRAARDAYQRALGFDRANAAAHLGLGQALQQLGDIEEADRSFDQYQALINGRAHD